MAVKQNRYAIHHTLEDAAISLKLADMLSKICKSMKVFFDGRNNNFDNEAIVQLARNYCLPLSEGPNKVCGLCIGSAAGRDIFSSAPASPIFSSNLCIEYQDRNKSPRIR